MKSKGYGFVSFVKKTVSTTYFFLLSLFLSSSFSQSQFCECGIALVLVEYCVQFFFFGRFFLSLLVCKFSFLFWLCLNFPNSSFRVFTVKEACFFSIALVKQDTSTANNAIEPLFQIKKMPKYYRHYRSLLHPCIHTYIHLYKEQHEEEEDIVCLYHIHSVNNG